MHMVDGHTLAWVTLISQYSKKQAEISMVTLGDLLLGFYVVFAVGWFEVAFVAASSVMLRYSSSVFTVVFLPSVD
ncbi:hypothetical protein U1Q18_026413 [Sarracenia purpurea var. burkii]